MKIRYIGERKPTSGNQPRLGSLGQDARKLLLAPALHVFFELSLMQRYDQQIRNESREPSLFRYILFPFFVRGQFAAEGKVE
jgi:hypothetical protein